MFGVATVADAHKLHESLNDLRGSYLDVAHSLSEQLTYIKKLDFFIDFELIAGTRIQNIHLYYKLISVTVMGDAHGIKLFINVPLKTAEATLLCTR